MNPAKASGLAKPSTSAKKDKKGAKSVSPGAPEGSSAGDDKVGGARPKIKSKTFFPENSFEELRETEVWADDIPEGLVTSTPVEGSRDANVLDESIIPSSQVSEISRVTRSQTGSDTKNAKTPGFSKSPQRTTRLQKHLLHYLTKSCL